MSFDQDFVPAYFTKETKRVETEEGNIGIFREGTDTRDLGDVDTDLKDLNLVIEKFSESQDLSFKPSNMYYHYRFENNSTVLKMAHTILTDKRDVTNSDVYFIGKISSLNRINNPIYIAKLNDRMYSTSRDICIWVYENQVFKKLNDLEGKAFNIDIHNSMNALYAWPGREKCDPFWEVAKTVHPSLKGKGFR